MAISPSTKKFRQILRRSLFLTAQEGQLFDQMPDAILDGIFRHNFNGNLAMAERILFNRYKRVDEVDRGRLEQEKRGIYNMARVARQLAKDLTSGRDVLFVTDNDNDGSLSQAVIIEFVKTLPQELRRHVHVEFAQPIGETRGFTMELVDMAAEQRGWATDHPFTLITADNGINSRSEQDRIAERYPRSTLVITDHHLPDENLVVLENERTSIVNPKYKPTEYFKQKNISGANTLGVLLDGAARDIIERFASNEGDDAEMSQDQKLALANIAEIGSWANLLDYANADMADMPTRPYIIEKALGLRPLLNVSNSMSNLITSRFTEEDIQDVLKASKGVKEEWLREKLDSIATLNIMARKLLGLYHRYEGADVERDEKDFYAALSDEMAMPEFYYTSINPNYIEQLRPAIFNLSAIDNKDLFMTLVSDTMVDVYKELRSVEKDILNGMREVKLLRQDKRANSTILYPVDKSITKIFNRRLLGKAYNQDNNGFILTLSSVEGQEVRGSMRSLYPIQDILKGKEAIESKLGIALDFQGHAMAAGFFISSTNGEELTEAKLSELNDWIDDRVAAIKLEENINQMPNLELDFAAVALANKINGAVKANLAGMWGLPTVLKFAPNKGDEVYITDAETTEQLSLSEVVKRKSYGYQAIATDFGGGAIVVPVELLRSVVESGYKKGLRMSYMDEGVFMGSQVVEVDAMPNLIPFKGGREDQEDLLKYYQETYKDSNFIPLSRQDFRNSPYFLYNTYGQKEFERWESLMIRMLDETGQDVVAVIDTEGTGLGKAPKCFNLGGTNIIIEPTSGKILNRQLFEPGYFRDADGNEFLLDEEQRSALVPLDEDEEADDVPMVGEGRVLYKMSLDRGMGMRQRYIYPGKGSDLEAITNLKHEDGEVIFNRTISGFAFAFLIKNKDFAVTKEFEDLTGIGNWMVERAGKPAVSVDKAVTDYYSKLKDMYGKPAKIIFQAHNMPYDKGVISANFQLLNSMMDDHLTSDTAKIARQAKLAYDDTPVSSFNGIAGLPAKAYFYDSPYSDYSLTTFLQMCGEGKGGVFADTTSKILLRYTADTDRFSLIDRKENRELELACTLDELLEAKEVGQMPNNAVRYSVERLSARAMIRNIILLDKPKPNRVELLPKEIPHRRVLEALQDNYHFDATPEVNLDHFRSAVGMNREHTTLEGDVELEDFIERFLQANRELQAKFHDGWIYEKVLAHFEPEGRGRVAENVIEQINYYTDLPDKKIRQVIDDVIRFKEHFGIDHALVHEQHNNIRQRSEDGQGLSDTAYESILPQMLAMMKFYNPFYKSIDTAVERLIDANIKGSLIQTMLGDDYNNELARDSYSVKQMLTFRRQAKTDVVKLAQSMARGGTEGPDGHEPIKFRLSGEILPPGAALYGQPKKHLSQKEVAEVAKDLEFILVNEQVKSAIRLGRNLRNDHCVRLLDMVQANDAKACKLRDKILTQFESVAFSRKDADIKKVSDMMKDAFNNVSVRLPRGFACSKEQAETARAMLDSFQSIFEKMGRTVDMSEPTRLVEMLEEKIRDDEGNFDAPVSKAQKEADADPERRSITDYFNPVRTGNFLPTVDIIRREPMKFVLNHYGMEPFLPFLKQSAAKEAKAQAKAGSHSPSRSRAPAP